jgi:iron(III) transport system permease protein
MNKRRFAALVLLPLFIEFMLYPLSHVLLGAFFFQGQMTLRFFSVMFGTENYRDTVYNSLNIALSVTAISSLIAYPLALLMARLRLPCASILHALLLAPLVVPPFVGVLGIRQLLGRFGSINVALLDMGIIATPIDWLGTGNAFGIVVLHVIHLVPILYLSIRASLENAHVALEEAAVMCGASSWRVVRKIILPLSLPGWFAGATLVFIASFTDLGTPLLFEYREVVSVQIFNMLSDMHENPVGYSFVVFTCMLSLTLFVLSKASMLAGSFAGSGRSHQTRIQRNIPQPWRGLLLSSVIGYALLACIPQLVVVVVALSKEWFMSVFPQRWTTEHFYQVLQHPVTARSLLISMGLSLCASVVTVLIGFFTAHIISRGRGPLKHLFEVFSLIPIAIPGIVFAFGFIGAFSGTLLDNRINPFPLLIIAYSVRRIPAMVRAVCAGLQEASRSLEEAAVMVGASPWRITRRITFPLIRRHLAVGAILTFAYSMVEVSDSLLLALETKFYPVAKAIYFLTGRPDGFEVASALGVIVMVAMLIMFYLSEFLSQRGARTRRLLGALLCLILAAQSVAAQSSATQDELVAVSPHWEGIRSEFGQAFSEKWRALTGRSVNIRWLDVGGASDIVKYIKGQFRQNPKGIGIDLVFGGGSDSLIELDRYGLLDKPSIASEVLAAIPSTLSGVPLYSPNGTWFANALSAFGILFNKVAIERLRLPTPSAWSDLADPRYYGYVAAGDPRKSGSMHAMYEIILQGYGWDSGWNLLQRIARNIRNFSGGASQIGKEVAVGEVIYGIAIDTYAGDIIRLVGEERLGYALPRDFAALNGDAFGMLKGAPNSKAASAFMEFVLSEAGQRIWYAKLGEPGGPQRFEVGKLSILPSLYGKVRPASVIKDNPFTMPNILAYDADKAGRRWTLVNDLFGSFIIDPHKRIAGTAGPEALRGIPVSEGEAEQLLKHGPWGEDASLRTETLSMWSDRARAALPVSSKGLAQAKALPGLAFGLVLALVLIRRLFARRPRSHSSGNFN